jgi:LCP family protein required for cell wall assembly
MRKGLLKKILIAEVLIASLAMIFIIVALWNKPLGPALASSPTEPALVDGAADALPNSPADQLAVAEPTPTQASLLSQIVSLVDPRAFSAKTICGGPASMTILLVGSDERSEGYLYGLADAIRLVRVDFSTPSLKTLDIPRDLWVEIPGISDHYGVTHGKLNQAYFFGNPGMGYFDGAGQGPGLLADTLKQNFGVSVDHYVAVDMSTFVRLVDAIDGIDIYLGGTTDLNQNHDGENPLYVFEPGMHHMDGQMALKLAMNRYPNIFQRARNQDIVLKAIEAKLLSPEGLTRLPNLISVFSSSIQTDLSPNDISKLVCLSRSLGKENISMVAFPDDLFTNAHVYDPYRQVNTSILEADFNQLREDFSGFLEGTWPQQ